MSGKFRTYGGRNVSAVSAANKGLSSKCVHISWPKKLAVKDAFQVVVGVEAAAVEKRPFSLPLRRRGE